MATPGAGSSEVCPCIAAWPKGNFNVLLTENIPLYNCLHIQGANSGFIIRFVEPLTFVNRCIVPISLILIMKPSTTLPCSHACVLGSQLESLMYKECCLLEKNDKKYSLLYSNPVGET